MPAKASTKGAPKAAPNAAEKVKNAAKSAPRAAERAPGNVVSPVTDIDAVNMEHYHEVDALPCEIYNLTTYSRTSFKRNL